MMKFKVSLTDLIGESNEDVIIKAKSDGDAFNESQRIALAKHKLVVGIANVTLGESDITQR